MMQLRPVRHKGKLAGVFALKRAMFGGEAQSCCWSQSEESAEAVEPGESGKQSQATG